MLYTIIALTALYALYVGGRLKQAETKIEIIRAALTRHLETGQDYRSASFNAYLNDLGERGELVFVLSQRDTALLLKLVLQ